MKNLFFITFIIITGCVGIPENISPVDHFEINKYLGTWYEIARLDHSFERGLSNVTATYTLREDEGINVLNKGYDKKKGEWKEAKGKAYFVSSPDIGRLKVSFWGPFYGGYNIIALDKENYSYAVVCGSNRSYLWILAREKRLAGDTLNTLVEFTKNLQFDTDKLIFVDHSEL
jgi:apolipoprotein D and lipocalin family protein